MTEAPVAPATIPDEPTTQIKPSEALRLGRLLYPIRLERAYFFSDGACAIGAIAAGYGYEAWSGSMISAIQLRFDRFGAARVAKAKGDHVERAICPTYCRTDTQPPAPISWVVTHLNDYHHWTDDQIVGWLEDRGL